MEAPSPTSNTKESLSSSSRDHTLQPHLSQPLMFRSLFHVFEKVVPQDFTGFGSDEWPSLLKRADSGFGTNKALQAVVSVLQYLEQNSPATLVAATKVLADGSRYEIFRLSFGDKGVLEFYLDLLAKDVDEHGWTSDALRLVGNTCADLGPSYVNRERALAKMKLPTLLCRLAEVDKADIALGVLCNLCFDYEPAQVLLRVNGLFPSIIQLLERRSYNLDFLPQVCLLLDVALEDFNPEVYPGSQVITDIYKTITIPGVDIEAQVSLANAITALLKHEQIQKTLIADDKLSIILDLFVFSYSQDAASIEFFSGSTSNPKMYHRVQDPEDEAHLTALRSALSATLWDISSLNEFTAKYLPNSEVVRRLISWLSTDEWQMQLCACSIFRNIASSDQIATDMVMILKIHTLLIPILDGSSSLPILEEVIRLMKNLAVPAANKKELEAFESITILWTKFESPTLHYAVASLVRQLLRGCFGNIHRFLGPSTSAQDISYASRMVELYSNSDDSATKTEIARAIVEMWRTANSGGSEEIRSKVFCMEKAMSEAGLSPDDIVHPVIAMLVKSENSSLVTEGWFGLALMADSERLREGVYNALCEDSTKDLFNATINSQDANSKDRDNARILADKLLKDTAIDPTQFEVPRSLAPMGGCLSEVESS